MKIFSNLSWKRLEESQSKVTSSLYMFDKLTNWQRCSTYNDIEHRKASGCNKQTPDCPAGSHISTPALDTGVPQGRVLLTLHTCDSTPRPWEPTTSTDCIRNNHESSYLEEITNLDENNKEILLVEVWELLIQTLCDESDLFNTCRMQRSPEQSVPADLQAVLIHLQSGNNSTTGADLMTRTSGFDHIFPWTMAL